MPELKVGFLVVFGKPYDTLPEICVGEPYRSQHLPREGELMYLEGRFWKVKHIIHWESYYPTVVLVPYPQSDVVKY